MANPEHHQILKQGVEAWNAWRHDNRDITPDLAGAYFIEADLRGSNLSYVHLYETVFGNTNLTHVQGLATCRHGGPSILDHRTLAKSGPLPLPLLRGCGLPDTLIDYLPSLLNEPFQFYSCFISYSSADEDFCRRLHGRLQDAGLRVWFAPHDIQGGRKLHEQIDHAAGLLKATQSAFSAPPTLPGTAQDVRREAVRRPTWERYPLFVTFSTFT